MAPAAYFATATKARKRGPTETGNENIHFFKWLFGIGWRPHGSESRWLFLGVLLGADWEVFPLPRTSSGWSFAEGTHLYQSSCRNFVVILFKDLPQVSGFFRSVSSADQFLFLLVRDTN